MKKKLGSILTIGTAITALSLVNFFVFYSHATLAQDSKQESGTSLLSQSNSRSGTTSRPQPSATYCHTFASDFAQNRASGGVIGGALGGAAGGALIGSIFGGRGAGQGAAAGAVFGGMRGGSSQSSERDRIYRLAFDDCMNGNLPN